MDTMLILGTIVLAVLSIILLLIHWASLTFPMLFSAENLMVTVSVFLMGVVVAAVIKATKGVRIRRIQKVNDYWKLKFSPLLELDVVSGDIDYIKYVLNKAILDKDINKLEELEYHFLDELVALEKFKLYSRDAHEDINQKFISNVTASLIDKINVLRSNASDKLKVELDLLHK